MSSGGFRSESDGLGRASVEPQGTKRKSAEKSMKPAQPSGSQNLELEGFQKKYHVNTEEEGKEMASMEEIRSRDNLYTVLGLKRECTPAEIRSAYQKLALKWHPHRSSCFKIASTEETKRFKEIQHAYSVLSDGGTRFVYDIGAYNSDRNETTEDLEELQELFNQVFRADIRTVGTSCQKGPTSLGDARTSSSVPAMAQAKYDVFISFRREDTGNNFTSHLLSALSRKKICVFKDFDEISRRGQPILDTIENSRVSIVILSKNYGSSSCCLDELTKILECRQKKNRVVLPVFYQGSPSEWGNGMGNFGGAFERHDATHTDQKKRWTVALKETAHMPGYVLADRSESELIDEIVKDVSKMLCSNDNKSLIGMDSQIDQLLSLQCIHSLDVRSIGIWGMGGIGKTAVAREVLRRISDSYEGCFFFEDLHSTVRREGHNCVLEEFFSKILEVETHVIRTSDMETSFLRSRVRQKKVLVVLDNVNDFRDVEILVGKLEHFGPGSRIIITSRNRRVLVQCKVNYIYEVKPLDVSESLQLFCCCAFQNNPPAKAYWKQSLAFVNYANGNPLVLSVLGSFLRGRSKEEWGFLPERFQRSPLNEIHGMLARSYYGLGDNEKSIFLDIACFFRGKDQENLATLLDGCGFFAHVGISGLIDKSLITISDNTVDMHNVIREMGLEIVRRESVEPGERSRLWNISDIRNIFINNAGTAAIEGIFLDMSELTFDASPTVFEKMYNLRLLKFYCSKLGKHSEVSFPQDLEYLPTKLRLLHWENYPLSSLPCNFDPKNLVELHLPNSRIKKLWKGTKSLEKLKRMRLSYSPQLIKIPRLSRAQNLEHIDLEGCKSLVKISSSIRYLKELVSLKLKDCSNLRSLPSMVNLQSLEVLNLSGCSELEKFPEISPNVKELFLGGTAIQEVPSSVKNLAQLVKLDLEKSERLENLPTNICKLKYLEVLNLSGCLRLESFPDLSRSMKSLWFLDLSRTAIKELPSSISYLIVLQELRLVDCRHLVKLPDNLSSLKFLRKVELRETDTERLSNSSKDLVGTKNFTSLSYEDPYPIGAFLHIFSSLHSLAFRLRCLVNLCLQNMDVLDIPEELCQLHSLNALDLSGNDFQKLPECISQLSKLESLDLSSCKRLESIPELPSSLAYLDAHSCKSLKKVSWKYGRSPTGFNNSLDLELEMPGDALADASIRTRSKANKESQGFFKPPRLTVCFPTNAWPELLNSVNAGSSAFLFQPSSRWNNNLLTFTFFIVVALEKHYHNSMGFAVRCMCDMKSLNGEWNTLERLLYCWSPNKSETRIRGDHMCIFYDYSMQEPLVGKHDGHIEAYFKFYPVDGENKLLTGCKVTSCAVYMPTAERENKTVAESVEFDLQNAVRHAQSGSPGSLAEAKYMTNTEATEQWTSDFSCVSDELSLALEDSTCNVGAAPPGGGAIWRKYEQKARSWYKLNDMDQGSASGSPQQSTTPRSPDSRYPSLVAKRVQQSRERRLLSFGNKRKHTYHKPLPNLQSVRLMGTTIFVQADTPEQPGSMIVKDWNSASVSAQQSDIARAPDSFEIAPTLSLGFNYNNPWIINDDTEQESPSKRQKPTQMS